MASTNPDARAVLRLFVRLERVTGACDWSVRLEHVDEEQAAGMLTSPHSGFHLHTAGWVPQEERAFATSLAR